MERKERLELLERILGAPTAPFHEYDVSDAIVSVLKECRGIELSEDHFGNLIARYGPRDKPPGWVFGSHMDHPGWVALPDGKELPDIKPCRRRGRFAFLGGVPDSYLKEPAPIKEFGEFAMWDLPAFELRADGRIQSRACDDLIGCAAIVATLVELDRDSVDARCVGLFTRAEEVGFVGAIEAAANGSGLDAACFVSIETSVATARTRMGKGPMCRVGDRLSIFDHVATTAMQATAEKHGLKVQRALLDRGACEATALQAFGVKSTGISVPLGNYHNCGPDHRIEPEFVDMGDLETLELLMRAMVDDHPEGPNADDPYAPVRERMEKRVAAHSAFIDASRHHFSRSPDSPATVEESS